VQRVILREFKVYFYELVCGWPWRVPQLMLSLVRNKDSANNCTQLRDLHRWKKDTKGWECELEMFTIVPLQQKQAGRLPHASTEHGNDVNGFLWKRKLWSWQLKDNYDLCKKKYCSHASEPAKGQPLSLKHGQSTGRSRYSYVRALETKLHAFLPFVKLCCENPLIGLPDWYILIRIF
jgi:hypothetical protein